MHLFHLSTELCSFSAPCVHELSQYNMDFLYKDFVCSDVLYDTLAALSHKSRVCFPAVARISGFGV